MTIEQILRNRKISNKLCLFGLVFWIIETLYFLIAHGWHIKAINEYEKNCDSFVGYVLGVGVFIYALVIVNTINKILDGLK